MAEDQRPQNIVQGATQVGQSAMEAMKSTPLAVALLLVNVGFLGFAGYVLGQVAANASERNKSQMDLIIKLTTDIRDCKQGPRQQSITSPVFKLPPLTPMKGD